MDKDELVYSRKEYDKLQAENEKLKEIIESAKSVCADEKARAKGQMAPERKCIELSCNRISQVLKNKP